MGTLALSSQLPSLCTPSMSFGAWFGVCGTRVPSPPSSPLGAPSIGSGIPSETWAGSQVPGRDEGCCGGKGRGRTGVGFSFSPLAGFYESLRQDLK